MGTNLTRSGLAAVALLFAFLSGMVEACHELDILPGIRAIGHIQEAEKIVLARMVEGRSKDGVHDYRFRILETVKGDSDEFVELAFDASHRGLSIPLGEHTNVTFWLYGEGGSRIGEDCRVRPSFGLGRDYLLMLGDDPVSISYEEIALRTDRWLRFVNQVVSDDSNLDAPLSELEVVDQFGSLNLYRCPSDQDERGAGPVLLKSLKGALPVGDPWPTQGGIRCDGEPHVFVVLSPEPKREGPEFYLPVNNGKADLSHYTQGVELVPGNSIDIGKYFGIDLSSQR